MFKTLNPIVYNGYLHCFIDLCNCLPLSSIHVSFIFVHCNISKIGMPLYEPKQVGYPVICDVMIVCCTHSWKISTTARPLMHLPGT